MDKILVKEYVRGDVRCNVLGKIIRDVAPSADKEYVPTNKRSKNFLKSYRREFTYGMYRFDSYYLGELESKLVRSLYGPVTLIVYNHFFQYIKRDSILNFMEKIQPYEAERVESPGMIMYQEFKVTPSTYLSTETTIFLNH